ncbi:hypothetical protein [Sphingomonas sp. 3-13AW]|uniref:hypothetical protein n=1 Tax=Sphingomonas sp. 3-13AW TaxID=3050450 RepID=UPI003BB52332
MSTILLTMVGILFAALSTTAWFVYYDEDSGWAVEGGLSASHGITSLEQIAASYAAANGARPQKLADLDGVDLPELPRFPGAAWEIANGHVCLKGTHGTAADRALLHGANRLKPKAMITGECGGTTPPSEVVVLSYPLAS